MLTSLATGIRWSVKKAVKENFTTHPRSNSMYYIMFTVVMAAPTTLKQYIRDQKFLPKTSMFWGYYVCSLASVAITICGALLNAVTFIGSNLSCLFSFWWWLTASLKKKRHKALEACQAAYAKYEKEQTKLLDWIETQHKNKLAQENFTYYTNYAYKLHNRMY